MSNYGTALLATIFAAFAITGTADAFDGRMLAAAGKIAQSVASGTETVPGTCQIEVAFSPKGGQRSLS